MVRQCALRGLQNGECHGRTTEVKEPAAVDGNMLAVTGAGTEMAA